MKKLALLFLAAVMALAALTASAAVSIPLYEGYPVCVDGNLWIEVPNAYEVVDATIDYPCMYLMSEKMDVALLVKIPENYKRSWLSQSADLSGFREDGAQVLSGVDATEASTVIERYAINDLPAVRVDMTGQGYEMIWMGDGGDMYFIMYPLEDADFAQDMRDVADTMHLVQANTPVETQSADFEYSADEHGVTITRYTGSQSRVAVPAQIDGKPVIALGDNAFYECPVTWVEVPDSVQSIGAYCFSGCTLLQTLKLSQGLTALPDGMLESCFRLLEIDIPDSVTTIGASVFWGNFYLSEIRLPTSLETLEGCNFVMAEYLERFIVPEGNQAVKTLDDGAVLLSADGKRFIRYCGWQERESYAIPEGVEVIDAYAFADWGTLCSVTVPEGVTTIEAAAFISLRSLQTLTLPGSAVNLGVFAPAMQNGEAAGSGSICGTATIIAPEGSAAQAYAEQYNLIFEAAPAAENTQQE